MTGSEKERHTQKTLFPFLMLVGNLVKQQHHSSQNCQQGAHKLTLLNPSVLERLLLTVAHAMFHHVIGSLSLCPFIVHLNSAAQLIPASCSLHEHTQRRFSVLLNFCSSFSSNELQFVIAICSAATAVFLFSFYSKPIFHPMYMALYFA